MAARFAPITAQIWSCIDMDSVAHRLPGLVLTDHTFTVPLDHSVPSGEQITVFAREVVAAGREDAHLPWLVFFQGGPGFPSPRPATRDGWIKRALQDYRVLLLDQRGTGRSTPVTFQTLARFSTAQAMADYLKFFRADSIIQDAEWIRLSLLGEHERWSVLGQSYGGFCVTHYLSAAPDSLKEAIITGGLPSLDRPVDDVYRATYPHVIERNRRYYERYPDDVGLAQTIVNYLTRHDVHLPTGDRLSPRRFQQLGMAFGASDGFEPVHYLLEQAFVSGVSGQELGYTFLRDFENTHHFDTNPIYAILHEAEFCQQAASRWSAERIRAGYPEFELSPDRPVFFTGEMVYPWMFDEYQHLRPLKEAAEILAAYDGWPRLYDPDVLRANSVPCVAAVYYNDMYVERIYSEETARTIRGARVWVTNEYEHNALRADGEVVLNRLFGMLHNEI
jgi:pimeloyl-ACP methyl ester carboxylesterase